MQETIRALFNHGKVYIFLSLLGIALVNMLPLPCVGIGKGFSEPVFSVTSTNEPLYKVLGKISQVTGYEIEITKSWQNKLLTADLKNCTLEEGIKKIIRLIGNPSHSIVRDNSLTNININIFADPSGYPSATAKSLTEIKNKQTDDVLTQDAASSGKYKGTVVDAGTKTGPLDGKGMPQEVERQRGVTERELIKREAKRKVMERETERKQKEPPELEIIPPGE